MNTSQMKKAKQYTLIKLPLKELCRQDFAITADRARERAEGWLIAQGDSLLFDQIQRLRGKPSAHISEVILVEAPKNPRQEEALRHLLCHGFTYNGMHYARFGKSASQGRGGITAFVQDSLFQELYRISQLDIPVDSCVISKYEAQRGLLFSTCSLIHDYIPNIVIVGEYEKILPDQLIKYVVEQEKEYTVKETGEARTCRVREIQEGYRDIRLSPFDGCGCHEWGFTETVSRKLGLDSPAIGTQIRLPFLKGYSVYVPFREAPAEWGVEFITDIYGVRHPIDSIDCIWNTSMFKGHGLFRDTYGNHAWSAYMDTLRKYRFKLGISKCSHDLHKADRFSRMNFQYLQCLDLWNPKYVQAWENHEMGSYDILDSENDGRIVGLARYTTALFERILAGDPFYACKFLGLTDTHTQKARSRYLEAVLINPVMLEDPAVKQFLYRKLKKSIDEAKVGRIYCSGFYHTGIGDMIGYLQYAAGLPPVGCLKAGELYSGNFSCRRIVSFRSPLVDPSEVNQSLLADNPILREWFGYLKGQDIVMFNMYDLAAPQQGGADFDGDIFFLCDDPIVAASRIEKPIILDIEDKAAALAKPYTLENLMEYELMTQDNRIGEITNVATSIENRYTTDPKLQQRYSDDASLLRIFQGKEIDFLKTGVRWHMNSSLRKHAKQLPYFLLYNYPNKQKTYQKLADKNRQMDNQEDRLPLNAYHSPSPMNELCDYICTWEKKRILWNRQAASSTDTRPLILDSRFDVSNQEIQRYVRRQINTYAARVRALLALHQNDMDKKNFRFQMEEAASCCRQELSDELSLPEEQIANYVIHVSYSSASISKSLAWTGYGDYILQNLKANTGSQETFSILPLPEKAADAYEYLGRYYEFKEGDSHR